jgi:hypothetical protein
MLASIHIKVLMVVAGPNYNLPMLHLFAFEKAIMGILFLGIAFDVNNYDMAYEVKALHA